MRLSPADVQLAFALGAMLGMATLTLAVFVEIENGRAS